MIQLPQSTIYGKRMPKEKFYSHLYLSTTVRKSFVNDVDYFVWQNKLSPTTINIAEGEKVKEIAIFNIYLKGESYAPEIFEVIDRSVPVYVIYVLHFNSKIQLLASYKEPNTSKQGSFKIVSTFVSDWLNEEDVSLELEGLNLDAVYENFVRQIAGAKLQESATESIVEDIAEQQRREKIEKQIALLQAKKRKEPQFNKQIAISAEIKKLREML